MKKPTANCFAVRKAPDMAFEIIYALFIGGKFKPYIGGTCVPFIRINDVRKIVESGMRNYDDSFSDHLIAIRKADAAELNLKKQLIHIDNLKVALSRKIFK